MVDEFNHATTLESIRAMIEDFVSRRNWERFHTPRNVALALVGEVGEVCELLQWKGEVTRADLSEDDITNLGEELSDVLVYTTRLAALTGVDLSAAVLRKIRINHLKYPVELSKGKAVKYTELEGAELFKRKAPLTEAEIAGLESKRKQTNWWHRFVMEAAEQAPAAAAKLASTAPPTTTVPASAKTTASAEQGPGFSAGLSVGIALGVAAVYGLAPLVTAAMEFLQSQ